MRENEGTRERVKEGGREKREKEKGKEVRSSEEKSGVFVN